MTVQPVKVIHVINTLKIGGAENCVRLLLSRLDRRRFVPIVVAIQNGGPYEQALIQEGVVVKVMHRSRRSILLFPLFCWDVFVIIWELYHYIKREKPAILQTHLPVSEYMGLLVGRWAGVPHLIYTFHSSNFLPKRTGKSLRTWARIKLTMFLLRRVQRVVAVSTAIADKLKEIIPGPNLVVRIIPNGIELNRFNNVARRGTLKKELGMDPEAPLMAAVGSLSLVKNQSMILYATSKLIRSYPKLRVIIVGEGPLKKRILRLREQLGLTGIVHLLGVRSDIPEILSETDIFVSTSLWEGLPLSILEAMASGKPIVATAVPGVIEVLEGGVGLLVPSDNQKKLIEAIAQLIENSKLRENLGQKAQERVAAYYSLKTTVQRWEALYEAMMFGERTCPIK